MINILFLIFVATVLYFLKGRKQTILGIGLLLLIFGVFAIYSVSIYESFTLTKKLINLWIETGEPYNNFYFSRHLRNLLVAGFAGIITYKLPIALFQKNKNVIILAALVFLFQLAVFLPAPIGTTLNGARWWISIGGAFTLQPSEFFKLWYVLFLSSRLLRKKDYIDSPKFFSAFIVINSIALFVFALIPDFGTILILSLVGLIMARYAGARLKYVLALLGGGMVAAFLGLSILGSVSTKFDYIHKRFTYFINSDIDPEKKWIWRQNEQALLAIGGWGVRWQWLGKWLKKMWSLPEAQSDFIFAAFSEEIGFLGNLVLLGLYFYLCFFFLKELSYVKDPLSRIIWVGIISLIIVQVFVNTGVNLKIMPNTWLTLPFISFGGTALMVNIIEILLLYKIIQKPKSQH